MCKLIYCCCFFLEALFCYIYSLYGILVNVLCCLSFSAVSVCVSCFTLVAISLERYFAICRPLHSRKWQTLSHSYKTIVVCWTLGFVVCVPIAVFTRYTKLKYGNAMCQEVWQDRAGHKAYTIFLDVVLLVLPVIVMSISYGKISHTLWMGMKMEKQEMGK